MSGKYEKMKKLIQDIEGVGFECEAGYLSGLVAWQELKKEIEELGAMERLEPRCVDIRLKNHIERMEVELQELGDKIERLAIFIEREKIEPKFTDEEQRIKLVLQKEYMINYAGILKQRIYYDTLKANKDPEVENHIELLQRK